jgi:hypothetical protein
MKRIRLITGVVLPQANESMGINAKLRRRMLQGFYVLPQTQINGEDVPASE